MTKIELFDGDVFDIPTENLHSFRNSMVAREIKGNDGGIILPRGVVIDSLSESEIDWTIQSLLRSDITEVPLTPVGGVDDDEFHHDEEAQPQGETSRISEKVCRDAIRTLKKMYTAIEQGESDLFNVVPVIDAANQIAREISLGPEIILSMVGVNRWHDYGIVHSFNVALISGLIARGLSPCDQPFTERAVLAGLLHDVGMIRIPSHVRNKKASLSPEDLYFVQAHVLDGEKILRNMGVSLEDVILAARHHHERWGGDGYPDGLAGEDIPLMARIVSVADVFDAVTSNRIFKRSMFPRDAVKVLIDNADDFDPQVMRTFLTNIGLYPPGSLVKLSDGSVGMVVASGGKNLVSPVVVLMHKDSNNVPVTDAQYIDLKTSAIAVSEHLGFVGKRSLSE